MGESLFEAKFPVGLESAEDKGFAAVVAFEGGTREIKVGFGGGKAVGLEAASVVEGEGGIGDEEGIGGVFFQAKMVGDEGGELLVDRGGRVDVVVEEISSLFFGRDSRGNPVAGFEGD